MTGRIKNAAKNKLKTVPKMNMGFPYHEEGKILRKESSATAKFSKSCIWEEMQAITNVRVTATKVKNPRKWWWFPFPTQLLIQGQWWSNLSTHLLQMLQCLDRLVLMTSQSGHNRTGSKVLSSCKKLTLVGFSMYPGFVMALRMKKRSMKKKHMEFTMNQAGDLKSIRVIDHNWYKGK